MSEQTQIPSPGPRKAISGRAANRMPFHKYRRFEPIPLTDRQWPSRTIDSQTTSRPARKYVIRPMFKLLFDLAPSLP